MIDIELLDEFISEGMFYRESEQQGTQKMKGDVKLFKKQLRKGLSAEMIGECKRMNVGRLKKIFFK